MSLLRFFSVLVLDHVLMLTWLEVKREDENFIKLGDIRQSCQWIEPAILSIFLSALPLFFGFDLIDISGRLEAFLRRRELIFRQLSLGLFFACVREDFLSLAVIDNVLRERPVMTWLLGEHMPIENEGLFESQGCWKDVLPVIHVSQFDLELCDLDPSLFPVVTLVDTLAGPMNLTV